MLVDFRGKLAREREFQNYTLRTVNLRSGDGARWLPAGASSQPYDFFRATQRSAGQ